MPELIYLVTCSFVQMIETIYNNSSFQFKYLNTKDVQDLFENLNARKTCSDTGLMPKLMKKVTRGYSTISEESLQQMF